MANKKAERVSVVDDKPLGAYMVEALNVLRNQLRAGGVVFVPAFLVRALPEAPGKGDRALVDDWRGHKVWAEYDGEGWLFEVYDDGQRRVVTQD